MGSLNRRPTTPKIGCWQLTHINHLATPQPWVPMRLILLSTTWRSRRYRQFKQLKCTLSSWLHLIILLCSLIIQNQLKMKRKSKTILNRISFSKMVDASKLELYVFTFYWCLSAECLWEYYSCFACSHTLLAQMREPIERDFWCLVVGSNITFRRGMLRIMHAPLNEVVNEWLLTI